MLNLKDAIWNSLALKLTGERSELWIRAYSGRWNMQIGSGKKTTTKSHWHSLLPTFRAKIQIPMREESPDSLLSLVTHTHPHPGIPEKALHRWAPPRFRLRIPSRNEPRSSHCKGMVRRMLLKTMRQRPSKTHIPQDYIPNNFLLHCFIGFPI